MLKIGILFGGRSAEHEVSLCSAASVIQALNKDKYEIIPIGIAKTGRWHVQEEIKIINHRSFGQILDLKEEGDWFLNHYPQNQKLILSDRQSNKQVEIDVVFPVLHGTYSEDGTIQGLLELSTVPYVGAGLTGSVLGIDKDLAKRLWQGAGLEVVPWKTIQYFDWLTRQKEIISFLENEFAFPFFVKPAKTGSSVGVKKIMVATQIKEGIEEAFQFDDKILVEQGINAREIECAVLGNDNPEASVLGEIIPEDEFYSYQSKYLESEKTSLIIPAKLDESLTVKIREMAIKAYQALNCLGMARVDFFLDKNNNSIYLNEINTIPGFTQGSMYPKLWEKTGLSYEKLLDKLIDLALENHQKKMRIIF